MHTFNLTQWIKEKLLLFKIDKLKIELIICSRDFYTKGI